MGIITMLVVGVLAGMLASFLMKGRGMSIIAYLLVGLAGSFIGGFLLGRSVSITSSVFANVLITATIGAVVLLAVIRLFAIPAYTHKDA